jgi:hypothetical protein
MTAKVYATHNWVGQQTLSGGYTGTGIAFDITTNFVPKKIEIIVDATGESVIKTSQQTTSKCFLRKKFGTDQVMKSYLLEANGITFGTDKVTIGTSSYINDSGVAYSYTIWG